MIVIRAVDIFFRFLSLMIFIRVIISWFPMAAGSNLGRFIYQITEPMLEPFRVLLEKFIPRCPGLYIDFSPIIALLVIDIIKRVLLNILIRILI